jgi:hypothetical protein
LRNQEVMKSEMEYTKTTFEQGVETGKKDPQNIDGILVHFVNIGVFWNFVDINKG